MEKLHIALLAISITLLLFGCAPTPEELQNNNLNNELQGEPTPSDNNSSNNDIEEVSLKIINENVDNTSQLVADEDFGFRTDRDLTVSFPFFPSDVGKIVIYHAYDHHDTETNTYYPDYSTRLASYSAVPDYQYQIVSLREWQHLVFEWLPMDGKSNEQYLLVTISDEDEYILSF